MIITAENYFSPEANMEYMGSTQYKNFRQCEAKAMATLSGEYVMPMTDALMMGKYLDAWNNGNLDEFRARHPELISSKGPTMGQLKANYRKINDVIEFIEKDAKLMEALSGQKQRIFTGEMFGTKWKVAVDSYFQRAGKEGRIVDLKYIKELFGRFWEQDQDGIGTWVGVFQHWGYWDQISIYPAIEQIDQRPGETVNIDVDGQMQEFPDWYEPFIVPISKQDPPDKDVISFDTPGYSYHQFIEQKLSVIESYMPRILLVKSGKVEPIRCETCDHCRATKVLTGTTHFSKYDI